ncbi:anti-sigma factor antagonist [Kineococcus arenarius]|uniref:anti-sigma factor antagonist n=1 Tax=Kineococcus sp. SYSU DK007 TaxID=3383128 RepID=UPI003D7C6D6E
MSRSMIVQSSDPGALSFAGELDASNVETIRRLVHPFTRGARVVELDLSGVTFLDCAALGVLVELSAATRVGGGSLRVVGLRPRPAALVRFFGLEPVLDIAPGAGDAAGVARELRAVFTAPRREVRT